MTDEIQYADRDEVLRIAREIAAQHAELLKRLADK